MTFFSFLKYPVFFTLFYAFFNFSPVYAKTDTKKQEVNSFYQDLESFTKILGNIKRLYVDETNNTELFEDAIKGMVGGLDPHSSYLKPKEQKKLLENTSGKFGGLGIMINAKEDLIEVISPIDDTPAYRAGIQAGDLIIKIGDKPVRGMTLEEGVDLMRGKPNTKVELTILRKNKKPFKVDITRQIITIVSVKGYLLEKDMGYIRISSFQIPTANLLKQTFDKLTKKNEQPLKSLILDLRNNPGGLLNAAIDVSNLFIDEKGLVVYTKGRIPSSNTKFKTELGDIMHGAPMVVLINEGSASASEIVSGALQDHKRAVIMGKTSFGKASVQTIIDLKDGHGLKITTARYYTPLGRSIQAKGIEPDIVLKNIDLENEKEDNIFGSTTEKDLEGHLVTEDLTELSPKDILKSQENKKIEIDKKIIEKLKKDYFVHEASNLLKALTVLEKGK